MTKSIALVMGLLVQDGCSTGSDCPERSPTIITGIVRTATEGVPIVGQSLRVQLREGLAIPGSVIVETVSESVSGSFELQVPAGSRTCRLVLTTMSTDSGSDYIPTTVPFPTSDGPAVVDAYATPTAQTQSWFDKVESGAYLIKFFTNPSPPASRYVEDNSTPAAEVTVTGGTAPLPGVRYLTTQFVVDPSLTATGPLGAAVASVADIVVPNDTVQRLPISGSNGAAKFGSARIGTLQKTIMLLNLHECSSQESSMSCTR